MHGAMVEAVKPWQQKGVAKKEVRLASAEVTSPSLTASASPIHKEANEGKKTKFCMYHLQGVCMYTGDSCAFAHSVEEMQGARGGRNERTKDGVKREKRRVNFDVSAQVAHIDIDPPVKPTASQRQPQPQPRVLRMPPPQPPRAALAPEVQPSTPPGRWSVQYVQSPSIPDQNNSRWRKMDEPMYVQPCMFDNLTGYPDASTEEHVRDVGLSTESAQILSMLSPAGLQMSL